MYAEEYRPVSSHCCFVCSNSSKRLLILIQFYLGAASHGSFTHTLINNCSVSLQLASFIFKISPLNFYLDLFILFFYEYVCLYGSLGKSEEGVSPQVQELQTVVSCLAWVQGTKHRSYRYIYPMKTVQRKRRSIFLKRSGAQSIRRWLRLVRWVLCKHNDLN